MVVLQVLLVNDAQTQSPVGRWSFKEGAGTTAADVPGHGHSARLANGLRWVGTPVGQDLAADAAMRQYVRIAAIDLRRTNGTTVTLWVDRT